MSELDDIRQSIYDWIKDHSAQLDDIREKTATDRKALYSAVTQLSNELFGFGKRLEAFIEKNEAAREKRQQWQDYKDIAIGCLMLLTLAIGCSMIALLAYLVLSSRSISV